MLSELLSVWSEHKNLSAPPDEPIELWSHESRSIYIEDGWGPPVPYPPITRHDGSTNHGYTDTKRYPGAISQIPETKGYPELEQFLNVINEPSSPIESVGCEKGFFPVTNQGTVKVQIGSYIDVIYSDSMINNDPRNHLLLAEKLSSSLIGCEEWWASNEIGLQRLRSLSNCPCPWGLMVRICNHGRDKVEARKYWGESLDRMGDAIRALPFNFPLGLSKQQNC